MGEDQAEIHRHQMPVARAITVPLAVDAEQDVAPVPEPGAEMDLLVLMLLIAGRRPGHVRRTVGGRRREQGDQCSKSAET